MALTVGSKLLGFVRDQVIAFYFGASGQTDAYLVAMTLPNLFMGVWVGAIGTAFLPVFSQRPVQDGDEAAWRVSDTIFALTAGLGLVMAALGVALAPWLVRLMAPGFDADTMHLAVAATRIVFPAVVLAVLTGPLKAVLNSFQHFTAPAAAPIVQNLVILVALVGLVGVAGVGVEGLAVGLATGMVLSVLMQFPALRRRGFRLRLRLDLHDPGVRRTLALVAPLILGALFGQVYVLVDRALASGLPAGSIAALSFADKLRQLPLGVFAAAVATVVYPSLSQMAARGDVTGLKDTLGIGIRLVALVTVPSAVGLMVLREPLVRLLFQRGAFDAGDTAATAAALLFYALGMVGLGANAVLVTAFYSLRDTVTPVVIGGVGTAVNIALDYLLVGPLAHAGLALANSVTALVSTALLLVALHRRLGAMGYRQMGLALGKVVAASLVMGSVVLVMLGGGETKQLAASRLLTGALGQIIWLAAMIIVGALVYLAGVLALRVEEAGLIRTAVSARLRTRQRGGTL